MSICMACQKASAENESDRNAAITVSRMTFLMAVEQNTAIMVTCRNIHIFKYAFLLLILGIFYSLTCVIDLLALEKKLILQRFPYSFQVLLFNGPAMVQGHYHDTDRQWYKDIIFACPFAILTFLWAIIDGIFFEYQHFGSLAGLIYLICSYLPAIFLKPRVNLKWVPVISFIYFIGVISTMQVFVYAPIFISPVIASMEAIVLQLLPKCYDGKANPYGPRYVNSTFCFLFESFKHISLAKVILLATITGRWSSVVLFGIIASCSHCYAQTELCFLLVKKLFRTKIDSRSTLYLQSFYSYQWFAQKIIPFISVFFCFWVQVTGVEHNTFMAAYNQSWLVVLAISLLFEICTEILIYITHIVLQQFEVVLFEPRMQFAFRSFTIPSTFTFLEVTLLGTAISGVYGSLFTAIEYEL